MPNTLFEINIVDPISGRSKTIQMSRSWMQTWKKYLRQDKESHAAAGVYRLLEEIEDTIDPE